MIIQEPIQAAIWHCLNHYDFPDAVFLSERLYAEVKTTDTLYLLATAYYRSGKFDQVYHLLRGNDTPSLRFLFANCAYEINKYSEAEKAILKNLKHRNNLDEIVNEFGEQAPFVMILLSNIAEKCGKHSSIVKYCTKALELNPFLWCVYEKLCKSSGSLDPNDVFKIDNFENLSNQRTSVITNVEALFNDTMQDDCNILNTPQSTISKLNGSSSSKFSTPDETPFNQRILMSGFAPITEKGRKLQLDPVSCRMRLQLESGSIEKQLSMPTFGAFYEAPIDSIISPILQNQSAKLIESNSYPSLAKRMKAQVDQLMNRKDTILLNSKPVFSQSTNVPVTKTQNIPLAIQPSQNVRRSSRLFSNNNYSVKENSKSSPNRTKFVTPKSPLRKTKRMVKCSLNNMELNNRNKNDKEKMETITTNEIVDDKSAISLENCLQYAMTVQKLSADGLMKLFRTIGNAFKKLTTFKCDEAIAILNTLPSNQYNTPWVWSILGLAYYEKCDYESCCIYFKRVHDTEPYRAEYMDIYSTALWHLQNEITLSALAQDLVINKKRSPVTWCVNGNCFSLHKEHDLAIKYFQRAVQINPYFPYAYTLLGHEYITTEELDKALGCFRSAIRIDPYHYNAWFGMGTIYSKQERFELAELHYIRALTINPESSVLMCHVGVAQNALKQPEKALDTFNMALSKNPKSALCKFHRGSIYFTLGRHNDALKELEELKEIVPKESVVYYLIGKIHKKLGNTDLALMHFSWATDLDPKGASSQIKEVFDPSVGRSPDNSPRSQSSVDDGSESISGFQAEALNFGLLPEDSEDSL